MNDFWCYRISSNLYFFFTIFNCIHFFLEGAYERITGVTASQNRALQIDIYLGLHTYLIL